MIEMENHGYAQSFGTPSADPYLAKTLPRMGAMLENYYAIGHASADNYIAQVSGQAPDLGTRPTGRSGSPSPATSWPGRITRSSARLRLPGGGPHAWQPAIGRRAQLGGVPAGHGQ